ncbi:MAG: hypothetical protein ABI595_08810 [Actinomycetota bacterium]
MTEIRVLPQESSKIDAEDPHERLGVVFFFIGHGLVSDGLQHEGGEGLRPFLGELLGAEAGFGSQGTRTVARPRPCRSGSTASSADSLRATRAEPAERSGSWRTWPGTWRSRCTRTGVPRSRAAFIHRSSMPSTPAARRPPARTGCTSTGARSSTPTRRALTRSDVDRAALIGRLHQRANGEWLAELLIDLEEDEPARLYLIDALHRLAER